MDFFFYHGFLNSVWQLCKFPSASWPFCPKLDLTWDFTWSKERERVGTWHQTHTPELDRGLGSWSQLRGWLGGTRCAFWWSVDVTWVTWWVLGKTSIVLSTQKWVPRARESYDCVAHGDLDRPGKQLQRRLISHVWITYHTFVFVDFHTGNLVFSQNEEIDFLSSLLIRF